MDRGLVRHVCKSMTKSNRPRPLSVGEVLYLVGRAPVSGVGFSILVTVSEVRDRVKGQRYECQEIVVWLPGETEVVVMRGDLADR